MKRSQLTNSTFLSPLKNEGFLFLLGKVSWAIFESGRSTKLTTTKNERISCPMGLQIPASDIIACPLTGFPVSNCLLGSLCLMLRYYMSLHVNKLLMNRDAWTHRKVFFFFTLFSNWRCSRIPGRVCRVCRILGHNFCAAKVSSDIK